MHSTILWSDEELEMIKTSLLYEQTLKYKAHIEKIYLSIKHVLDRFPEYFEDVTLDKFKHAYNLVKSRAWRGRRGRSMIPFADFFNHDIDSETRALNDDFEQFIAGKNYAPGDEVFLKYVDISNDELLLHFGFMIPFSQYDTVLVEITVPQHDHLRAMMLALLDRHTPLVLNGFKESRSCRNYFLLMNVESSCVEGLGIPISLRA
ncbi:SET domain-containing protein, partial [Tanacetum coccineum]